LWTTRINIYCQPLVDFSNKPRGVTTAEKLRGTKVWVPTPGRLRECVRESPPTAVGVRGYDPRIFFFENSHAKSCILVASALISGLPRTCVYPSKVGGPIHCLHCWSPQPKSWGTSLPRSPRLFRLCMNQPCRTAISTEIKLRSVGVGSMFGSVCLFVCLSVCLFVCLSAA